MHLFGKNRLLKKDSDTFTFTKVGGQKTYAFLGKESVYSGHNPPLIDAHNILPVSQVLSYFQLINDKEANPKKIKAIRLICDTQSQFFVPIIWNFTDANGAAYSVQDSPLNMLSPMQFQGRVIDTNYDNLVVGNNEWFTWAFAPGVVEVTMTFVYDDYRIENLLSQDRRKLIKTVN